MPIIIPVPDPEPEPDDKEEEAALRAALTQFTATKSCPLYLRVAAQAWLST